MESEPELQGLTLGRQLSSRVWLAHDRREYGRVPIVVLAIGDEPPTHQEWALLRNPFGVVVANGMRYLVAEADDRPAAPRSDPPFQPRLRAPESAPDSLVSDILTSRRDAVISDSKQTFVSRIRNELKTRRTIIAFGGGVAVVLIALALILVQNPTSKQDAAVAISSPQATPSAMPIYPDAKDGDESSITAPSFIDAQWLVSQLSSDHPSSQARLLSKALGWTSGMEIASRQISRVGDVAMYVVCVIDATAKASCVQIVTSSSARGIELREIIRPAT